MRTLSCVALLGVFAGTIPAVAQSGPSAPEPMDSSRYVFQRVVYQNSGGYPDDKSYAQRLLRNIGAHVAATEGKVEIRVVSFAAGAKLFLLAKEDADLAKGLDGLRAKGVRFLLCRNTLEGMKLKATDLYGVIDADVVPSGVAEVARLQGMGFVYVHP
jgi:intracellular sulfur oxidation DsrE/DsrF family protein